MDKVQQFRSQQEDREQHNHDGHELSEAQAAAVGLGAPRRKAQNVQRGKPENDCPEDVVNVSVVAGKALQQYKACYQRGLGASQVVQSGAGGARETCNQH